MTFDDLLLYHDVSREERTALVWHLASVRARRTVELLMDDSEFKQRRAELLGILRAEEE